MVLSFYRMRKLTAAADGNGEESLVLSILNKERHNLHLKYKNVESESCLLPSWFGHKLEAMLQKVIKNIFFYNPTPNNTSTYSPQKGTFLHQGHTIPHMMIYIYISIQ